MKKKFSFFVLAVSLLILSCFTSCGSGYVDPGKPVIHEVFFTINKSTTTVDFDQLVRLKTIKVNNSKSGRFDNKYTFVVDFTDNDLDVCEFHYSTDGFESQDLIYSLTQIYKNQYTYWYDVAWSRGSVEKPMEISCYLLDRKGNKSDIYKLSVNTEFSD